MTFHWLRAPQRALHLYLCHRPDQRDGIGQNLGGHTAHAEGQAQPVDRIAAQAQQDRQCGRIKITQRRGIDEHRLRLNEVRLALQLADPLREAGIGMLVHQRRGQLQ